MPEASSSKGMTAGKPCFPLTSAMPLHLPTHISETRQSLSKSHAARATRTPLSSPAPCRLSSLNVLFSNSQNSTLPRCP